MRIFGAWEIGHDRHTLPRVSSGSADVGDRARVAVKVTVRKVEARNVHAAGDHAREHLWGLGGRPDGAHEALTAPLQRATTRYAGTLIGSTPQISSQYSRMVLSEEKKPHRAELRIDMRVHRSSSRYT